MHQNDNRDIYIITPLVFVMVVACTHLVKKMLAPAKAKTRIVQQSQPQKPQRVIAQIRPQQQQHRVVQQRPLQQTRGPASVPAQIQPPVQHVALSVEDANITPEEQALLAEKESKEYNGSKETEFLRQALGLGDAEIAAVYQKQQSYVQEISVYNRQINAGMVGSQYLKEEAIKLHQKWMEEHIGAENYRQLLSLVQ